MYERQSGNFFCNTGDRKQEPGVFVIVSLSQTAKRRFVTQIILQENHEELTQHKLIVGYIAILRMTKKAFSFLKEFYLIMKGLAMGITEA